MCFWSRRASSSVTIGLLLTLLDTVLETLLVLVRSLKLHLAELLSMQTCVDHFLVNLVLLSLDCFIQVHSCFRGQEGALRELFEDSRAMVLLITLLESLSSLLSSVSLLELVFLVLLEQWLVHIFIVFSLSCTCAFSRTLGTS